MGLQLLQKAPAGLSAEPARRCHSKRGCCTAAASDEQLLARYLSGDACAFEHLVKRYRPDLLAFLTRLTGDAAAAEDVTQETFLRLHRSADKFESTRGLRPWLFSIAANAARDHHRYHARRQAASLNAPVRGNDADSSTLATLHPANTETPHARLERAEVEQRVRRAVDRMPMHLREILLLSYFQQLSYNEISSTLQIPLGTVKSRLHAAVAHFAMRWGPNR
jgi:RNA polymerase sigma-70 factor (ECF subfamily)